jgi:hypothetical protein
MGAGHRFSFFEPGSWCFLFFLKAQCSILIRSRVFVFEPLSIHFDAHAFLLVGNFFEGSNVVSRTLLQPFVAGHDSSGQDITLQDRHDVSCPHNSGRSVTFSRQSATR